MRGLRHSQHDFCWTHCSMWIVSSDSMIGGYVQSVQKVLLHILNKEDGCLFMKVMEKIFQINCNAYHCGTLRRARI
jgi:hypothetical protein